MNAERIRAYCETRDPELRNRLAEENLHLVSMVARRFSGRGVEYDDLYQVAALALLRAIERFDDRKGVQLSTFVLPCIVGEVKNYFRDRSRVIRMPRRGGELVRAIENAKSALIQTLHRSPTASELADALHVSVEEVLEALAMQSELSASVSLDEPVGDEDETSLSALLGGEDEGYQTLENQDLVKRLLEALPEMDQKVMRLRFFGEKSQREVAATLGVSQMTVSRLERRAVSTLRGMMKDD